VTVSKTREYNKITLTLEGRLDAATSPQLQEALIQAFDEGTLVELDFAKLTYVSSAGLRVLLIGQKAATAKNARMTLCGVSPEVMDVFEMTGFADVLTFT